MTAIPLRRIEGKYEILDKLGEGGMGAVYKVRHRLLDEVRVIKVMRPQLVQDEGLKARFLREARVAIQLRHPNIAQLYDFTIDEDGVAFIVMEYIEGITLENVVGNGGLPSLGLALEIAQQSLRALAYLHGKGFIHRDISPDNLMLTEGLEGEPLVKLIDLGIAKTLEGGITGYQTQAGTFLGKVRYAPPEQFGGDGAAAVDARGDLYSFGIVLYELLTGQYPIRGRDPTSIIAGHLFWPPLDFMDSDPNGRIPTGVREAVLKSLAKKPDDRFPGARELSRALAAFRRPSDITAGDLREALQRGESGMAQLQIHDPGSTQDRLDFQFGLQTTPSAASLSALTGGLAPWSLPTTLPAPPPAQEIEVPPAAAMAAVAAVTERVEAKLAQRDWSGAELLLYEAEVDFGPQEAFAVLHERIAEEQRRDREARTAARRRAEQLSAAVAEIEARLSQGDLDRAGEALDETAASFGEDTIPLNLRVRLRELRKQAREAELSALLETARERLESGDLPGTLETVGQIEALEPGGSAAAEAGQLRKQAEAELRRREEEARRKAELAAAVSAVETLLGQGDLDGAQRQLDAALAAHSGDEALLRLAARLADRRHEELEARVDGLLEEARQRFESGDLDGSLEALGRMEELAPGRPVAGHLRKKIQAEQRQREKEARRQADLGAAAAAIEARLDQGDLDRAAELLHAAVMAHGGEEALLRLQRRLTKLRRAELESKVSSLLESARRRLDSADLAGALDDLGQAETLVPNHPGAGELRERIEAERRRRDEEARREAALAAAVAAIDAHLENGELESAAELLPRAMETFGDETLLRHRRQRVDDLQRRSREERAAARLADARRLAASGNLDEALAAVRESEQLRPGQEAVRALTAEIEAERQRRAEVARREAELAAAVRAIDDCLDQGRLEEAARLVPAAVATYGGEASLRERWERLEALRRKAAVHALLAKAESLLRSGETDRAARTVRQALDLDPGNREAEEMMRRIPGRS